MAYDELGNLISLTYPGGEIVRYTYYKNGLLNTVTDSKGRKTTYEYDANENLTVTTRPNGTKEIRTFNAAGQMTEQRDVKVAEGEQEEIILQYTYTYDAAGNIASITGKETTDIKERLSNLSAAVMTYDEGKTTLTRFLYNGRFGISTDDNGLYYMRLRYLNIIQIKVVGLEKDLQISK